MRIVKPFTADIDPTQQYGDYLIVAGHDTTKDILGEVEKLIAAQIEEIFKDHPDVKIRRWKDRRWQHEFDDKDAPDGRHRSYEIVERIGDSVGIPVTLYLWKSIPKRK